MAVLRVSYIVSLVIFTVVLVIVIRTAMFSHKPVASDPCMPSDLDFIHADDTVITRFQKAISFETISYSAGNYNRQDLLKLQQFIFKGKSNVKNGENCRNAAIAKWTTLSVHDCCFLRSCVFFFFWRQQSFIPSTTDALVRMLVSLTLVAGWQYSPTSIIRTLRDLDK